MKTATALEQNQFDVVVNGFINSGDLRMASLSLLAGRALRISDLLELRISDCFDMDGEVRKSISVKEIKTIKCKKPARIIPIWSEDQPTKLYEVLSKFYSVSLKHLSIDSYLFTNGRGTRLTRQGVHHLLQIFKGANKIETISAHSIRKYPGRLLHSVHKIDVETIQEIYQHSSPSVTRLYLGISKQQVQLAWDKLMV